MCVFCGPLFLEDGEGLESLSYRKILKGKRYRIMKNDYETAVWLDEVTSELIIEFGEDELFRKKINYCPVCGRKLWVKNA